MIEGLLLLPPCSGLDVLLTPAIRGTVSLKPHSFCSIHEHSLTLWLHLCILFPALSLYRPTFMSSTQCCRFSFVHFSFGCSPQHSVCDSHVSDAEDGLMFAVFPHFRLPCACHCALPRVIGVSSDSWYPVWSETSRRSHSASVLVHPKSPPSFLPTLFSCLLACLSSPPFFPSFVPLSSSLHRPFVFYVSSPFIP